MGYLSNVVFVLMLVSTSLIFYLRVKKIRRNIFFGVGYKRIDDKWERLKIMMRVAIGQSKMSKRPFSAALHIVVYLGFVIINIEILEIVLDGILGTHRLFAEFLGSFYNFLIGFFEYLALGVIVVCVIFLARRFSKRIKRFDGLAMTEWPKKDALIILYSEIILMSAFLFMNASDFQLQNIEYEGYQRAGSFPVSKFLVPFLSDLSAQQIFFFERGCWWFHIAGILAFLNYLPFSKHFHIVLAFPNVYYSKLSPAGKFNNMDNVRKEVELMMDPNLDPYASPPENLETANGTSIFGAKDITDLSWKSIMDSYTCTECGRCTDQCPANQTGKMLSPRKIMMDVRDRAEEYGKRVDKHGKDVTKIKTLLNDYISVEELWACTSCNACVEACPVNNDPLAVIVDLRRYLVMEESKATSELNNMFGNIENNGAPWAFAAADRLNWAEEED
ncbi:MAG: Fe-S oxidoreductase [Flavobacteriales bacterium]|nr:Fe-S oxidoreductase [Flavobacteriales bacterium]|tara:strand:+ start:6531 stop:7868 length:1338 start_codon:yes stop_codon:yes gene_type:complete